MFRRGTIRRKRKFHVALKTVYFVYEVYINATGCLNIILLVVILKAYIDT
jgi:hypothetical protein